MPNSNRKLLAVIGAGPKGIAIAIKAKVLEEFGLPVDRVVLIEKNKVGAHWSGQFGYTNGDMKLGTSPEKDVVFPIKINFDDAELNQRIQQRLLQFTWTAYLVQTSGFSDWVDRGRPAPSHNMWSEYLRWVSLQLEPEVKIVTGTVVAVDLSNDLTQWKLILEESAEPIVADRLMLTGPGQTRTDFISEASGDLPKGTYDLESFWTAIKSKSFGASGKLAIIGAGENAASILLALGQYAAELCVDVISPKGFISTRAESYYENQIYSQPERNHWAGLERADRIDFIERTDLGVFSVHAMSLLNEQRRHAIIPGRVMALANSPIGIKLTIKYAQQTFAKMYDQVILASGFDQVATLKNYFSERALAVLETALGEKLTQSQLMESIQSDLSVGGMTPRLHLPMLAGLTQGPGFANLSCLGRLSDRIVTPQVETGHSKRTKNHSQKKTGDNR